MAQFGGTSGADKWTGTSDNDIAYGNAGDDLLHGGDGIDQLYGGDNNDTLYGDGARDYLYGNDGDDTLHGGDGDDFLDGGTGDDLLDGGDGDDYIVTGGGNDKVLGGAGRDQIFVQNNAGETVTIDAGDDDDYVSLNTAALVTLKGGAGTDTLYIHQAVLHNFGAANGFEMMDGDGFVEGTADADKLDFSGLVSTDATRVWGWHINGNAGADQITGTRYNDAIDGGANDDVLYGAGGDDTLTGGDGHNQLHGGDGNDTLNATGASSGDQMWGDAGVDHLNGGNGNDTIHGGADGDIIWGSGGDANLLFGDDGNDTIQSSGIHDTVSGGNGDDTMTLDGYHEVANVSGGAGSDTLVLGNAISIHDLAAQVSGVEKIDFSYAGSVVGTDDADVMDFSKLQLVGDRGLNASAGAGADRIVGTSGNDYIVGESGDDVLEGGLGNDHLVGGVEGDFRPGMDYASYQHATGAVHVSLAIDVSQDTGAAGWDQIEGMEGLIGSSYGDTLTGSDRADSLIGGLGADSLNGGAGNDTIDGGDDADTINGGLGSDVVTGGKGDDVIDGGGLWNQDPYDPKTPAPAADVLKGGAGADTYVWANTLDLGIYYSSAVQKGGGMVSQVEFNAGEGDRLSILAGQGLTFVGEGAMGRSAHGSIAATQNAGGTLVSVDVNGDGLADSQIQLDHHVDLVETAPGSGVFTGLNRIDGTAGIDHLTGTAGNDVLHGLGGPDWLEGGLGNDLLDGGEGNDTASYLKAAGAVHVDLGLAGAQDTGGAGVDTLVSIEGVAGSAFGDTLSGHVGNALLETIQGRDGNDVIDGHGGYDQLVGGAGLDTYVFGNWGEWNAGDGKSGDQFGGELQLDGQDRIAMDGLGDFRFMGHEAFDASGQFEVRYEAVNNTMTLIQADADGDGHADYNYWVQGVTALAKDGQGLVMSNGPAVFTLGTDNPDAITGTMWNDQIAGLNGNDRIAGYDGDDQLFGQAGNDKLFGQNGKDLLIGGDNDDLVDGGVGNDTLMGGTGNDVFQFTAFKAGDYDTVLDLQSGEKIDLHALDANTATAPDDAFSWLGYGAFTGHAGELRMSQDGTGTIAYVSGDVDGDGHGDFMIEVHGDHALMQNDFIL